MARLRYERRRMREQAARARRRRRNTIIGASAGTVVVIAGLVALAVTVFGSSSAAPAAKASPSALPTPTATPTPPPPPTRCARISPNPPAKGQPRIPDVAGRPPTRLVVKDVRSGTGRAAKAGDSLSVLYVGVACSTGKVFDASYLHGNQPFTVGPLGKAGVIAGWNQGLVGVRAGGIRELVIPASLGYGATGAGAAIKPNETLIFLVTVKSVKP